MKVSDSPFEAVEPYLDLSLALGIDVFIGNEPLALQGMDRGAVGCVSGLAAAFPEVTAALVHDRSEAAHEQVCRLRDGLAGIPFHAALKAVLVARGVLGAADVRPPLRGLTQAERDRVLSLASGGATSDAGPRGCDPAEESALSALASGPAVDRAEQLLLVHARSTLDPQILRFLVQLIPRPSASAAV